MLALARILDSERQAIDALHRLLNIRGRVMPICWDQVHLCAELADGRVIEEEANIDVPKHDPSIPIRRVFLAPEAQANPEALAAIERQPLRGAGARRPLHLHHPQPAGAAGCPQALARLARPSWSTSST